MLVWHLNVLDAFSLCKKEAGSFRFFVRSICPTSLVPSSDSYKISCVVLCLIFSSIITNGMKSELCFYVFRAHNCRLAWAVTQWLFWLGKKKFRLIFRPQTRASFKTSETRDALSLRYTEEQETKGLHKLAAFKTARHIWARLEYTVWIWSRFKREGVIESDHFPASVHHTPELCGELCTSRHINCLVSVCTLFSARVCFCVTFQSQHKITLWTGWMPPDKETHIAKIPRPSISLSFITLFHSKRSLAKRLSSCKYGERPPCGGAPSRQHKVHIPDSVCLVLIIVNLSFGSALIPFELTDGFSDLEFRFGTGMALLFHTHHPSTEVHWMSTVSIISWSLGENWQIQFPLSPFCTKKWLLRLVCQKGPTRTHCWLQAIWNIWPADALNNRYYGFIWATLMVFQQMLRSENSIPQKQPLKCGCNYLIRRRGTWREATYTRRAVKINCEPINSPYTKQT